jgi:hypothetical protein
MLLTITQVAERLNCSRSHVHNLIRARWYADQPDRLPPPRLRALVHVGFPRARYLSASSRMPRIHADDLARWLEERELSSNP